jgi:hypothetical protein
MYSGVQSLGPVDLACLDESTLQGYQRAGQCFVSPFLEEVKRRIENQRLQALKFASRIKQRFQRLIFMS